MQFNSFLVFARSLFLFYSSILSLPPPSSHHPSNCADHDGNGSTAQTELLQMDYANLKHTIAELEDAVAQLKTGHCRRIQKYIR